MKKIVRNQEYDPKVLKKLHDLQLEMLQDLEKICDKYNLKYFAVFGTALGAVRHNGFIPWDDDMDVGMLRKDYEIFIRVVEKEMGDKYQIMTPEIDKNYACCVTKFQRKGTKFVSYLSDKLNCDQCIFLDRLIYLCGSAHPIIPYTGIKKCVATAICVAVHYGLKVLHISPKRIYKAFVKECTKYNCENSKRVTSFGDGASLQYQSRVGEIFPLKTLEFENITIQVMKDVDTHLRRTYGDYMKIPSKEHRINHAPYIIDFGE